MPLLLFFSLIDNTKGAKFVVKLICNLKILRLFVYSIILFLFKFLIKIIIYIIRISNFVTLCKLIFCLFFLIKYNIKKIPRNSCTFFGFFR